MWPLNFPWSDAPGLWRACPPQTRFRPSPPMMPSLVLGRGSGAGGPAWRTSDDPRPSSAGPVRDCDRAADGARPEDGAQIHRAWARAAGLRTATGRPTCQALALRRLRPRAARRLPRPDGNEASAGDPRARLWRGLLAGEALRSGDPSERGAEALRSALRDTARLAGAGGLRPFRRGFRGRAGCQPHHLAVQPGARPLPAHLRALRAAPGPADASARPHGGLRGDRWSSGGDPLRM